ncbi:MAG: hypothetical protein ACE5GT_11775 [Rhodospirillales bacterium]
MRLLDFQYSVVLTWTLAILGGVGALGVCAVLAFVLAMLQTGWFIVVRLSFCALVTVAPTVAQTVRRDSKRPGGTCVVC